LIFRWKAASATTLQPITMLSMSSALLSYGDAAALVAARARELAGHRWPAECAPLGLAAGRVLADSLLADCDLPPFPRSTRDGFACRATDAATRAFLPVAGTLRAGDPPAGPLQPGSVWEIMTGAPVPDGADAVLMLENVESADGKIRVTGSRSIDSGENIVPRGTEARAGDELVRAGTRLASPQIAVAAACGYTSLPVFSKPRVAILATGDELVPVESTPGPGHIRNSNGPMLAAMVAAAGGRSLLLPRAADDPDALDSAIERAASSDLLVITGGVSAGRFDLVEEALARAGARFHFTGVRIQPGKPAVFGEMPRGSGAGARTQPFFGLPGNPISSAATFLLFVAPVLAALAGTEEPTPRFALAKLGRNCKGKDGLTRFVPACCDFHPDIGQPATVEAVTWHGSGDLAAFAQSNCFLVVPEGVELLRAGETATILIP